MQLITMSFCIHRHNFEYFRLNHFTKVVSLHLAYIFLMLADIDDCASNPCENNGTCIDLVSNYTCNCTQGYTGKNCGIGKNRLSKLSTLNKNYCN